MNAEEVLKELRKFYSKKNIEGMNRFAIPGEIGVSVTQMRLIAKATGKNHNLALDLWKTKIHEARILASIVDEPEKVSEKQMEQWVKDFKSWDLCDQVCSNVFDKTPWAYNKVFEWVKREEEFVKRAGFVLMVCLSVHDKRADDKKFLEFFPIIIQEATDERNFVRKAVNWALRGIGKRNKALNKEAIKVAKKIEKIDSKSARWIAKDALRELQSENVQKRLKN
ncbi:MAG: DNA alkylation repair protein [archaeon]